MTPYECISNTRRACRDVPESEIQQTEFQEKLSAGADRIASVQPPFISFLVEQAIVLSIRCKKRTAASTDSDQCWAAKVISHN